MNDIGNIDRVMEYFYEISKIPRMSGKEEKIADYIERFAINNNLRYIRDKSNNIIIIKEAHELYKDNESILLQCHMDMVCEKNKSTNHNFEKDPIDVYIDGDFIKAKGTTLGADNGIGMAIIMSILESNDLKHPRIEAIFTVEEETTMRGAKTIDVSSLHGTKMICLDNMSEEELLIGCASAKIFDCEILGKTINVKEEYCLIRIELNGFIGGHSGKDISKSRGNPIKEMGNLLYILSKKYSIYIKDIGGGEKVNVIPRDCYVSLYIKAKDIEALKKDLDIFLNLLKNKIMISEGISINVECIENESNLSLDMETTIKVIEILNNIPNGVFYKDDKQNPLVSLNIGKINLVENNINISFSIRSNKMNEEYRLINNLQNIINKYKIIYTCKELSGYEHKKHSLFIEKCKNLYKMEFKKEPNMINKHIGLEAGFFGEKISNLDFIAIAPNIIDAHSPNEKCSISSLKRIYKYILIILENL